MRLFRPVGVAELVRIAESDFLGFPPRQDQPPYFYPALNIDYAIEIARDWNTQAAETGYAGFVTRFELDDAFAQRYEIHTAGRTGAHQELWIPIEEIHDFNQHIRGHIQILESYVGDDCEETLDFSSRLPLAVAKRLHELGLG